MLEAGHAGDHDFTPDDQITVRFAPDDGEPDACVPGCILAADHGGECDLRPEPDRWRTLYALLDAGKTDEQIYAGVERAAIVSQMRGRR